jgi:hypothetical protein
VSEEQLPTRKLLRQLINDRMAQKNWTLRDVTKRGGPPHSTLHMLATTDLAQVPKSKTIEQLAIGLSLPIRTVWDCAVAAAAPAALQPVDREPDHDAELLLAFLEEFTPEQRRVAREVIAVLRGWSTST